MNFNTLISVLLIGEFKTKLNNSVWNSTCTGRIPKSEVLTKQSDDADFSIETCCCTIFHYKI